MKTEMIPLTQITAAPFQPRKIFDPEKMEELETSLQAQGLIHPILVRPYNGAFQLIAGERRFRAAKNLKWPAIRAEIQEMDDLEAEEKSAVENFHRGDLTGQEIEDVVYDLWEKGKPISNGGAGRYTSKESLSKMLGWKEKRVSNLVSAKEARERLGLSRSAGAQEKTSTFDLVVTSGVTNDNDRKKLIALKTDEKITTAELVKLAPIIRDSPINVKEAVLDKPKIFTPEVAKELSKLPDTVQLGTIAAIKKGKMSEEEAIHFSQTVKDSSPVIQNAMLSSTRGITASVAKELSKLDTTESQVSTIEAIKAHRLDEAEAIGVTKLMSEQGDYSKKHADEIAEREREYALLMKKWELEKSQMFAGRGKSGVGRAFQNIMAHMRLVQAVHSDNCTCPHCGKDGSNYLRWTCCDDGKKEVLDKAYEYARQKHEQIVKEEKKQKGSD